MSDMTIKTYFSEYGIDGESITIQFQHPTHWTELATVYKNPGRPAQISYGSGGTEGAYTAAETTRAKAEALLRAAEVAEELDSWDAECDHIYETIGDRDVCFECDHVKGE